MLKELYYRGIADDWNSRLDCNKVSRDPSGQSSSVVSRAVFENFKLRKLSEPRPWIRKLIWLKGPAISSRQRKVAKGLLLSPSNQSTLTQVEFHESIALLLALKLAFFLLSEFGTSFLGPTEEKILKLEKKLMIVHGDNGEMMMRRMAMMVPARSAVGFSLPFMV